MSLKTGLTCWVLKFKSTAIMWRWNMNLNDAMHTCRRKTFGPHGYIAAGPLVVEW